MHSLDNAERLLLDNLVFFIRWESFSFLSYPYLFASHSHSCRILQPYVPATVQMHSDSVSTDRALRQALGFVFARIDTQGS